MSSHLNRRAALLLLGGGAGAAFLSACGSSSSNAGGAASSSASASNSASSPAHGPETGGGTASSSAAAVNEPSTQQPAGPNSAASSDTAQNGAASSSAAQSGAADAAPLESGNTPGEGHTELSGEVSLEVDSSGPRQEYATREKPQQNTYPPKKPSTINDRTERGLYSSISFAVTSLDYALQTGNARYLEQSAIVESEQLYFKKSTNLIDTRDGKYWTAAGSILQYTLVGSHPVASSGGEYVWAYNLVLLNGDFYVKDGKVHEVTKETYSGKGDWGKRYHTNGEIRAKYVNGQWQISGLLSNDLPLVPPENGGQ
ncbi:DUF6318 family protein [Rothia aeria]|jgi:mannan endo-1,4-beta-mannosidase|uniref:Lipoprotein n=1 Tax=Rothia aeria F0474 TaxID=1125724 RepID=I0UUR3_9MICC|nr:DUF6318 family protein [Rothia aeria]EID51616.1 putative lipoprotein [Rothia aeria F0474]MDK7677613.1 DUF6318 family protein [Rothia aeria]QQT88418.1 hypothetical protein I6I94_07715 [Rothia aeria]